VNVDTYLHQFQWDQAKYKLSSPLSDIVDAIVSVFCLPFLVVLELIFSINFQTVSKLEEELRQKSSAYQQLSGSILAEKRKKTYVPLFRSYDRRLTCSSSLGVTCWFVISQI